MRPKALRRRARIRFFALAIPARLFRRGLLGGTQGFEAGVTVGLERHGHERGAEPDDEHDGENGPALATILDHVGRR